MAKDFRRCSIEGGLNMKNDGIFTEEEIEEIRSSCKDPEERCLVEILLSTGSRPVELEHLKVSDIDFENLEIRVPIVSTYKTGERFVFISDEVASYIKKHVSTRSSESTNLFICNNNLPVHIHLRYILRNINKRCSTSVVAHRFRSTWFHNERMK